MEAFESLLLPAARSSIAPDGSDVRVLVGLERGGMAHFELAPGAISKAIRHRTVDEIWYFIGGRGEMWRRQGDQEGFVDVHEGVCISIPCGTEFQFRSHGFAALAAIGVTMPPWPGPDEVIFVEGVPGWGQPT